MNIFIVDANGDKIEFINTDYPPDHFKLEQGQKLIKDQLDAAYRMLRPRWTGAGWIEAATEAESRQARLFREQGRG